MLMGRIKKCSLSYQEFKGSFLKNRKQYSQADLAANFDRIHDEARSIFN